MPMRVVVGTRRSRPGELSRKRRAEVAKEASVADAHAGRSLSAEFAPTSGFTFDDACAPGMHYVETDRGVRRSTAATTGVASPSTCCPRAARTGRASRSRRPTSGPTARLLSGPHSKRNQAERGDDPASARSSSRRGRLAREPRAVGPRQVVQIGEASDGPRVAEGAVWSAMVEVQSQPSRAAARSRLEP